MTGGNWTEKTVQVPKRGSMILTDEKNHHLPVRSSLNFTGKFTLPRFVGANYSILPGSPNSKRSMLDGSDKSKSKSLTITKISSSTSPSNKMKFPNVEGNTPTASVIEILPAGSTPSGGGNGCMLEMID
jgi:hypothetical protein